MSITLILLIVFLILLLIVIFLIYVGYMKLKRKTEEFSRNVFGTNSLSEGVEKMQQEYAGTPKSVSAMTSLCLPKIMKDFPDFQYDEMKNKAQNLLHSYLLCINNGDWALLSEGNTELKSKVSTYLNLLESKEQKEYFDKIKIHRTEISNYTKAEGRCCITFQSSIQYLHYKTNKNMDIIEGNQTLLFQSRYEISLIYIQDRDLVENELDYALGVNCPNCGAPISSLGAKECEYCGTPVIELNIHAWSFNDIKEIIK